MNEINKITFERLKCINAFWKNKARDLYNSSILISNLSVPRLTQLINWRAAANFYFRRYDERNHAGLAIPSRKVTAQVQTLGSMEEE